MISLNESRDAQCDIRLSLKTQDQTLIRQAMDGAGLTRWEAQVLPRVVEDIYFQRGMNRPWKDGQVRYQCVDITAGPGRPLSECPLVPTALSVIDVEKDREVMREHGALGLRRSKLMRIAEEAREQGGVLTQEDLGVLLACDERTIRRDIKELREQGIHVPTRGYVQDIGPTLSHKGLAIRHWLEGKESVAVACHQPQPERGGALLGRLQAGLAAGDERSGRDHHRACRQHVAGAGEDLPGDVPGGQGKACLPVPIQGAGAVHR